MGIFNKCEEMCVSKWDKKVALLELFHFRTVSKAAQEKLRKGVAGIQNHTSPLPKEASSRAWPAAGAGAAPGCLCSKHCFQNRVKTKLLYPGLACHITDFFDAFEQMHIFLLLQLEGSPWGLSPARAPRKTSLSLPPPRPALDASVCLAEIRRAVFRKPLVWFQMGHQQTVHPVLSRNRRAGCKSFPDLIFPPCL